MHGINSPLVSLTDCKIQTGVLTASRHRPQGWGSLRRLSTYRPLTWSLNDDQRRRLAPSADWLMNSRMAPSQGAASALRLAEGTVKSQFSSRSTKAPGKSAGNGPGFWAAHATRARAAVIHNQKVIRRLPPAGPDWRAGRGFPSGCRRKCKGSLRFCNSR
jgi:hypothetical protein